MGLDVSVNDVLRVQMRDAQANLGEPVQTNLFRIDLPVLAHLVVDVLAVSILHHDVHESIVIVWERERVYVADHKGMTHLHEGVSFLDGCIVRFCHELKILYLLHLQSIALFGLSVLNLEGFSEGAFAQLVDDQIVSKHAALMI